MSNILSEDDIDRILRNARLHLDATTITHIDSLAYTAWLFRKRLRKLRTYVEKYEATDPEARRLLDETNE